MATLIIRNVNKKMINEFKTKATKQGITMGQAITLAMNLWVNKESKKPKLSILDLTRVDYHDPHASQNIDKILYGN